MDRRHLFGLAGAMFALPAIVPRAVLMPPKRWKPREPTALLRIYDKGRLVMLAETEMVRGDNAQVFNARHLIGYGHGMTRFDRVTVEPRDLDPRIDRKEIALSGYLHQGGPVVTGPYMRHTFETKITDVDLTTHSERRLRA